MLYNKGEHDPDMKIWGREEKKKSNNYWQLLNFPFSSLEREVGFILSLFTAQQFWYDTCSVSPLFLSAYLCCEGPSPKAINLKRPHGWHYRTGCWERRWEGATMTTRETVNTRYKEHIKGRETRRLATLWTWQRNDFYFVHVVVTALYCRMYFINYTQVQLNVYVWP